MPGQLFNLKRYFGKKDKQEDQTVAQATGQVQPQEGVEETTVVTKETREESARMEPYSGIGYPPGGGPLAQKTTKTATTKVSEGVSGQVETSDQQPVTDYQPPVTTPAMSRRVGMDVLTRLTQRSSQALLKAVGKAKELKVQYIDTEHVLWGLLQDSGVYQLLSELKVTPSEIQAFLEKNFKKGDFRLSPQFSPRVKRVLELSLSAARALGYEFISPEHLLLALAQEGEGVASQTLTKFGISVVDLNKKITGKKEGVEEKEKGKGSTLEQYCDNLTQKAREGKLDPVVGRAAEIERIIHILSRRTKSNPCLIGDAGVGKTAIVEGLAQKIASGDVPETLLNKQILSLDLMSLVAGARHRGEFEQRLKNLLKEIQAASGQTVLFIDEIQNMVGAGAGAEGTLDVSNIMKPSLARGELQAIGTTTITEYRKYIEKDPALERRFQPVQVLEPTTDQAMEMLRALRDKYEAFHKVSIADDAIDAAVKLSQKYIGDRFLPDKAVDLIDEAASAVRLPAISLPEEIKSLQEKIKRLEDEKKEAEKLKDNVRLATLGREIADAQDLLEEKTKAYEKKKSTITNVVGPDIIADIVSRWTGIPISRLTESESQKLLELEDLIHQRYINQEEAVAAVSEAVRRGRAGLTSGKRPIGSFIFMGPTGVGKTELCKVLADILFGSPDLMVRLDMSEYMEKHEVAKLIGAPPGYVGYEEGGQLTEAVRRHPYSVVLLDEVEKAHPDVFNILLQILDDGRLTDNKGHVISFKNTIICCTSNIGTQLIQREMLETGKTSFAGPAFSTYAITPTGREMVSLKDRFWTKTKTGKSWKTDFLKNYFAGYEVKGAKVLESSEKLPVGGFDCQVFAPSGEEMIVAGGRLWRRKSPIAKEWETASLVDYFKDFQVANAAPDDPSQVLPTAKIDTWGIDGDGFEVISYGERVWVREDQKTETWETKTLDEYLEGGMVVKPDGKPANTEALKNKKDEGAEEELGKAAQVATEQELVLPVQKWDIHLFTPKGEETLIFGNRFWRRKSKKEKEWTTGELAEYFVVRQVEGIKPEEKDLQLPLGREIEKAKDEQMKLEDEKFAVLAERLIEELKKFFRPEVLNRFDEVIVFRTLSTENMLQVVELQFKDLAKRLEEQNIGFKITPSAKRQIAILGYDPIYGARPLRRAIQRYIENPISSMIIKEGVKAGEIMAVDFDGNDFVFNVERRVEETAPAGEPRETEKYVCLDCGREFEIPLEGEEMRSGKREEKISGESPYGWESPEGEEQARDTMTPPVANFMDDQNTPLDEQQTTDNSQLTTESSQPTASESTVGESTEPVKEEETSALVQPEELSSQVTCPYCGSTNVKLVKEDTKQQGSKAAETEKVEEIPSPETPEIPERPQEPEGLEKFYGTEELPGATIAEPVTVEPSAEFPQAPETSQSPQSPQ